MSQTEPNRLRKGQFYTSPFSLHLPSHEETAAMPRAAHRRAVGTTLLLLGEEPKPALVPGLWTPVALCRFPMCVQKKTPNAPLRFKPNSGEIYSNTKSQATRTVEPGRLASAIAGPLWIPEWHRAATLHNPGTLRKKPSAPLLLLRTGPALAPDLGLSLRVHGGVCARTFTPP